MAVPMLQFAQMPLVQPRDEMAGFSNALLNAAQMRIQRQQQAEALQREEAQRLFQNQMAERQFGLQEQQFGLQKQAHEFQMDEAMDKKQREKAIKNVMTQYAPELQKITDPVAQITMVRDILQRQGLLTAEYSTELNKTIESLTASRQERDKPSISGRWKINPDGTIEDLGLTQFDRAQLGAAQAEASAQIQAAQIKAMSDQLGAIENERKFVNDEANKLTTAIREIDGDLGRLDTTIAKLKATDPKVAQDALAGALKDPLILALIGGNNVGMNPAEAVKNLEGVRKDVNRRRSDFVNQQVNLINRQNQLAESLNQARGSGIYTTLSSPYGSAAAPAVAPDVMSTIQDYVNLGMGGLNRLGNIYNTETKGREQIKFMDAALKNLPGIGEVRGSAPQPAPSTEKRTQGFTQPINEAAQGILRYLGINKAR